MGDFDLEPPAQLPFDLPVAHNYGREDFLTAPSNAAALTMIDKWPDWSDRVLLLIGPPGCGKTHLCAIFAQRSGAFAASPSALPSLDHLLTAAPPAITVDGVDAAVDDTALFHLLNFASEHGAFVLLTSRRALWTEEGRLPDLLSRLRRAPVIEIGAPDDELLRAVLEKLFRDRQLLVDALLLDYAVLRLERSLEAARAFAQELDREALARGRRVTRALAADVIARLSAPRGG
jgi:chromosomal replication initiation ATPase DnaA